VAQQTKEGKTGGPAPGRLRFPPDVEPAFAEDHFVRSLTFIRFAIILAIVLYASFGVLDLFIVPDVAGSIWIIRYAIVCPVAGAVLGLTFTHRFKLIAQPVLAALAALCGLGIVAMVAIASSASALYYAGLLLVIPWAYAVLRLRFAYATAAAATILVGYEVVAIWVKHTPADILVNNNFFFLSSVVVGVAAGYTIERGMRAEFVQRRLIDRERHRSDALLANILPQAIIDRLKARGEAGDERRLAEALEDVTVLFADAVGFTVQAEKTPADDLVAALDGLFSRFDALADRYGLEKIKTIGDAYMAVAGAPEPHPDHAEAAADMALAIIEELEGARWPSGDPILVRIGIASGPAVAGVIGQRKFAYDLWGDTVNLASRLQSHGQPGGILVSESVVAQLGARYAFGPRLIVDLKGKGPTEAWFLLSRDGVARLEPSSVTSSTEVGAAP
jgi:class 3 adenylate cyclase